MKIEKLNLGVWRIVNSWGAEYIVTITEVSDHRGGAFSGTYTYGGVQFGMGCFPVCEIVKMEKVS